MTITETTPYAHTPDGVSLTRELEVDALNWARLHPNGRKGTRRLHQEYRWLLELRRNYPYQGVWDRYRLAAAHQVLTQERGMALDPVPELVP